MFQNLEDFREHRRGSPLEAIFPGNSWKLGIIFSDYCMVFPPEDFLPNTLGNLPCFWDSIQ
jgi:hypothetical protein